MLIVMVYLVSFRKMVWGSGSGFLLFGLLGIVV